MKCFLMLMLLLTCSLLYAQPGAYQKKDPADPVIKNKAEMAVLFLQEENQKSYRLFRIREASAQVVAGMNYRLILELETSQEIEIWEVTLFQDIQRAVVLTEKKLIETKNLSRFRKVFPSASNPRLVGAYKERSFDEPEVLTMRDHLLSILKTDFPQWEWVQAHQAAIQIVAGMNCFFLIEVKVNGKSVILEVVLFRNLKKEIALTQLTLFETEVTPENKANDEVVLQELEKLFQQENAGYQIQNTMEIKGQSLGTQKNYWFRGAFQKETETQIWEILLIQEENAPLNLVWKRRIP